MMMWRRGEADSTDLWNDTMAPHYDRDEFSLAHDLHLLGNLGKRNQQAVFRIRDSIVYGPLDSILSFLLSPIGGSEGECSLEVWLSHQARLLTR